MSYPIHFYHANGFPAETYRVLLNKIEGEVESPISVLGRDIPSLNGSYDSLVEEVVRDASMHKGTAIGIGHSFGAALAVLAQAKNPGLFKSLVLLDPPIFSRNKRIIIGILRKLNIEHYLTPAKYSMKRREVFDSKEEALEYFASKSLFKNVPKTTLEIYVAYGLVKEQGKYRLTIPKDRETEIFLNLLTKVPKSISSVKGNLIYAEDVRLLDDADLKWWKNAIPNVDITPFPGSHMFPFEKPDQLANLINQIVKSINTS